ncbi:uncharacterized protein LOC133187341 [Saccostrea echinata]|uniref:uncharacterized protein LOC133187341 n=1 Tax=Saccostrea echinata TaxID=191078 RepID=UPI002A8247EC|nr:uncharacterized protein LOC133187341 [Saccostrea echinata]
MDKSETSEETINSHACIFDTKEQLPLPEFYGKYKSMFPMMAIVVGGHYGPTQWDDLSSDLVMRIDREFKQQRVLAKNPKSYQEQYISIPVNGRYKFNVVKSIKTQSKDQSMADILKRNSLPVLVQFSESEEVPKEGKGGPDEKPINLLIEYRHEVIYLQGNYFFQGCITKESASVTLSPFITMAPVHGLMTMTEENYDQYLQRMTDYVNKNSEFSEDTCNLGIKILEAADPDIAHIVPKKPTIDSGPAPDLPTRGSQRNSKAQSTNSSQNKRFDVGLIPNTNTQDLERSRSHNRVASPSVKVGDKNKGKCEKPPKPELKPKPVVTKLKSTNDVDKDLYEEIGECSKLQSQKEQQKKVHGYENDNFCPVQPIPIAQDSGEENDYEEYIEESISTQNSNREHIDNVPQPEYDYVVSQPYSTEYSGGAFAGLAPIQCKLQTPQTSNYASGRTIKELGEILVKLKLEKFVDQFAVDMVDGEIVQHLTEEDLKKEFKFTRVEAIRLRKYIEKGHIPV